MLEKGSEVGAHILSGAVIDPRALDELLPDWRETLPAGASAGDREPSLGADAGAASWRCPHALMPPLMSNNGNYTGSLGNLCRWLAEQAEALGVQVFPGFPASEVLFDESGAVIGRGDAGHGRRRATAHTSPTTSPVWNCTPNTRCSPKARAGI